jgi:hypothetical protein
MKRMKFRGRDYSRTVIKNNILKVWDATSLDERHDWYREAFEYGQLLAEKTRDLSKACGVIAALSPMKRWSENKKLALDCVLGQRVGHMGAFVRKAEAILASDGSDEAILDILSGSKIQSFYLNIRYPDKIGAVTIDRHAIRIAIGQWLDDDQLAITANQYEFFVQCYQLAAMKRGVSPQLMQSATWVHIRNNKSLLK